MKLAYPGSFDPFTNGHLHIVEKGLALEPGTQVTIIVAANSNKKNHFSGEDRVKMIEKTVEGMTGVDVKLLPPNTYTVHCAKRLKCDVMLRAMRTEPDFQDECGIYQANRLISDMETIYVMPDIDLAAVRSSLAMGLVGPSGWTFVVSKLLPENIMNQVCKKFCGSVLDPALVSQTKVYDDMPYHNWKHIAYCLTEFRKHTWNSDKQAEIGILLHDAFDPNNIPVLMDFLWENNNVIHRTFAESKQGTIEDVVRATNHGHIDFSNLDAKSRELPELVHDIDLSVLSWPWEMYEEYTKAIRKEYVQVKGIALSEFIKGRIQFLNSMVGKKIYFTNFYSELDAEENMNKELQNLFEERGEF